MFKLIILIIVIGQVSLVSAEESGLGVHHQGLHLRNDGQGINNKISHEEEHEHREEHKDENERGDEHEHEGEHGHRAEEAKSVIPEKLSKKLGLVVTKAGESELNQTISAYGNITTSSEQLSHVKARFPGLITTVYVRIGDTIKQGQALAKIESNDSLQQYKIVAPISGKLIQRHANRGEFAEDQVLFSIANFDQLWAEFRIYPSQIERVKAGQKVTFEVGAKSMEGNIKHLIPVENKPYQLARLEFDNKKIGTSPGILVEGQISVSSFSVPIVVRQEGIHEIDGNEGVFVKDGNEYAFTPLKLGRRDAIYVEVLNGLSSGQLYVSENSYLLKADVEKSEAEHEH